jgi:hypothetical protein
VVTGTHLPRNFLVREYKSLGSPGKRREEDNKMFFFRRSRLRVIYWTVGSMHRFWYKLCRSDRICHSNISGLEGAPSRPIQYYMHRNTELFLRNLPCDNSLMVYHADNSKYSPQHFTFWGYQYVISFISCGHHDAGYVSRLRLFFNSISLFVLICIFIWTTFFSVYLLVSRPVSFIFSTVCLLLEEATNTRHINHNIKQFLLWLRQSGLGLEFYLNSLS